MAQASVIGSFAVVVTLLILSQGSPANALQEEEAADSCSTPDCQAKNAKVTLKDDTSLLSLKAGVRTRLELEGDNFENLGAGFCRTGLGNGWPAYMRTFEAIDLQSCKSKCQSLSKSCHGIRYNAGDARFGTCFVYVNEEQSLSGHGPWKYSGARSASGPITGAWDAQYGGVCYRLKKGVCEADRTVAPCGAIKQNGACASHGQDCQSTCHAEVGCTPWSEQACTAMMNAAGCGPEQVYDCMTWVEDNNVVAYPQGSANPHICSAVCDALGVSGQYPFSFFLWCHSNFPNASLLRRRQSEKYVASACDCLGCDDAGTNQGFCTLPAAQAYGCQWTGSTCNDPPNSLGELMAGEKNMSVATPQQEYKDPTLIEQTSMTNRGGEHSRISNDIDVALEDTLNRKNCVR